MDDEDPDVEELYAELGIADWPDALDRDAALDAVGAFYTVVEDGVDVGLTITSDFENEVKAHLEPAWAAVFAADRGPYGRCMAKTMTTAQGGQLVIADVHLFLRRAPDPVPTFRHEALHVVLAQRDESLNRSRETIADHDGLHPDLVALAGIAAEEYRVERAVPPRAEQLWSGFEALTVAAHNAIRTAAVAYFYNRDVQAIWDTVMRAFSPMTVQAAYIAAWLDAEQLPTPTLADVSLADRMLGEAWPPVLDALRALPDATSPTDRDTLETAVIALAHRLDEWLEAIGFGCEQLEDGQLYFHVYEHEDWATRALVDEDPAV